MSEGCFKIRYTRQEAQRAARGISRRQSSSRMKMDTYECDVCGDGVWHVGHRPRVNKRVQAVRRREQ